VPLVCAICCKFKLISQLAEGSESCPQIFPQENVEIVSNRLREVRILSVFSVSQWCFLSLILFTTEARRTRSSNLLLSFIPLGDHFISTAEYRPRPRAVCLAD
jgi:hypothetical protein